jgi:hypothetical protein
MTFVRHSGILRGKENRMPGLDELTNPDELAEMLRRVLTEGKIELLYDAAGNWPLFPTPPLPGS